MPKLTESKRILHANLPVGFVVIALAATVVLLRPPAGAQTPTDGTPTVVPLYWWADTAVPYWYKGKALPSEGSTVNAIALAGGGNAEDFNFRWRFNHVLADTASGFGVTRFTFSTDFPVAERVDLTLEDVDGVAIANGTLTVTPVSPEVSLYAVRPLRGVVYERALVEFTAPSGEPYDFLAAPHFFLQERSTGLSYLWTLNDEKITGEFTKPWHFTLDWSPATPSTNRLAVEVEDPARPAHVARARVTIQLR